MRNLLSIKQFDYTITEVIAILLYKEVYNALCGMENGKESIRRFISPEAVREKSKLPEFHDIIKQITLDCDAFMREPLTVIPYTKFMRYFADGDRREYEQEHYFPRRRKLCALAIMAILSDDKK